MSTERTSALYANAIRTAVRERYAQAALRGASCCGPATFEGREETAGAGSCCGDAPVTFTDGRTIPDDIAAGSLGCGAPIDAAALEPGETVVDLGSGGGLDVFLVSDIVSTGTGEAEAVTVERWTACLAGAMPEAEYLEAIVDAGFSDVRIVSRNGYIESVLHSVTVRAVKPE